MRTNYFLLISCFLFLLSCGEKKITSGNNNTSNENTSKKEEDIRTEVDSPKVDSVKIKNARKKREEERKKADQIFHGIKCNYKGTIGDIPIRAYIDWVVSHKVCKAESYSEIFEPIKAQKNFGNNFLVT
jgi:hypothetical protein